MGVKHLGSFLHANNLLQVIIHSAEEPTLTGLVIDGLAFAYQMLDQCPQVPVAGGEYMAFEQGVRTFFETLKNLNIECAVVVNGVSAEGKLATELQRASARVDYYHHSLTASRVDSAPDSMAPLLLVTSTLAALQSHCRPFAEAGPVPNPAGCRRRVLGG